MSHLLFVGESAPGQHQTVARPSLDLGDIFLGHAEKDEQHQHRQLVEHLAHQVCPARAFDVVDVSAKIALISSYRVTTQ
jgi:hypothetical protein